MDTRVALPHALVRPPRSVAAIYATCIMLNPVACWVIGRDLLSRYLPTFAGMWGDRGTYAILLLLAGIPFLSFELWCLVAVESINGSMSVKRFVTGEKLMEFVAGDIVQIHRRGQHAKVVLRDGRSFRVGLSWQNASQFLSSLGVHESLHPPSKA